MVGKESPHGDPYRIGMGANVDGGFEYWDVNLSIGAILVGGAPDAVRKALGDAAFGEER